MKKRNIVFALLVSSMAISLAGCGNKNNSTPAGTDSNLEDLLNPTKENNNETTGYPVTPPGEPGYSGPTDAVETPTEKEEKPSEGDALKDGPVNPTHRKMYLMDSTMYNGFMEGTYTIEMVEEYYKEVGMSISEEKIEYIDNGYIVSYTINDSQYGISHDIVTTYNNRGEVVHATTTEYSKDYPDGYMILEADYVQLHFNGGKRDKQKYRPGIELTSDGKISVINECDNSFSAEHKCEMPHGAVTHEDNRTIIYNSSTCEIYDVTTRENKTVLESGDFEVITYNENGKIESVFHSNTYLGNGKDNEGNSYTRIQDYVDYLSNDEYGTIETARWTYDKNGNVLTYYANGIYTVYIYE